MPRTLRPRLPVSNERAATTPTKVRKIFESGLLKNCTSVLVQRGGFKVKEWSGKVKYDVKEVPKTSTGTSTAGRPRCGLSTRTASAARTAATGITKAAAWPTWGHHQLHALAYQYGRDLTAPVEITPFARRRIRNAAAYGAGAKWKYADGFTLVLESGEWGQSYDRHPHKNLSEGELLKLLQRGGSEETRRAARSGAVAFLRGGHPHAVAHRRQRRTLAPRGHDLSLGQCGLPLRTAAEVRPPHGTDRWRRGGQPPDQSADASPVASVTPRRKKGARRICARPPLGRSGKCVPTPFPSNRRQLCRRTRTR